MKKYIYFIPALLICINLSLNAQVVGNMLVKFVTLGNCYICKDRIERAVKDLPGIEIVNWSETEKATIVKYDKTLVDIHRIMKIIGLNGHDTEWYQADLAAYHKLIGSCCEYKRTIDYSQVKIGYLSLMDVWLGVVENPSYYGISVYPTIINSGVINIKSNNQNLSSLNVSVFSENGVEIYKGQINSVSENKIDVSRISRGYYLLTIDNGEQIIYTSKLMIL